MSASIPASPSAGPPPTRSRLNIFSRSKDPSPSSSVPSSPRFGKPRAIHKFSRSRSSRADESLTTPTSAQSQTSHLPGFAEEDDQDDAVEDSHPLNTHQPASRHQPSPILGRPSYSNSLASSLAPPADIKSETAPQLSSAPATRRVLHSNRRPSPAKRGRPQQANSNPSSRPTSRDPALTLDTREVPRSPYDSPLKERSSTMFLSGFKSSAGRASDRASGFLSRFRRDSSTTRDEKATAAIGRANHDDGPFVPKVLRLPLLEQARITRPIARIQDACDKTQIWMPALAWRCIEYLNMKAVEEEGLYRINGSKKDVLLYQRRFDNELDVNLLEDTTLYDPNTIASLFKQWLRELPEEIIPRALQDQIMRDTPGSPHYVSEEEILRRSQAQKAAEAALSGESVHEDMPGATSAELSRKSSHISLSSSTKDAFLSTEEFHTISDREELDEDEVSTKPSTAPTTDSKSNLIPQSLSSSSHSNMQPALPPRLAAPRLKLSTEQISHLAAHHQHQSSRIGAASGAESAISQSTATTATRDSPSLRPQVPDQPISHRPSTASFTTNTLQTFNLQPKHNPTYLNPAEPVPQALIAALRSLPPQNYYLLFATTAHLANLLKYKTVNKMNLTNLMICVGHALRIDNFILGWLLERWKDCWVLRNGGEASEEEGEEEARGGPRDEQEALDREIAWEAGLDGSPMEE